MLVYEHPDADATHVEPVQEVLRPVLQGDIIFSKTLLHFKHALRHGFHDVAMAIANGVETLNEPNRREKI